MIKVNEYFDGAVKSLGLSAEGKQATVGVMEPGNYTFTTGSPEVMRVISGVHEVQLAGESEWKSYPAGTEYKVPGKASFQVRVATISAYLCLY